MKQWLIFGLAFLCVLVMFLAGIDALSNDHQRSGMFFTFVGFMTIIGLVIDFIKHIKTRGSM